MTITELAELVADMRTAQREFFRTRSYSARVAAKRLEARVDLAVSDILEAKLFEK